MAKTEAINFRDFMSRDWREKKNNTEIKVLSASMAGAVLLVPKLALAAGVDGTFGNVHGSAMNMIDAGVVLVIMFAGCAWGLGHRTKGLEILIGVSCGYIIARHAIDIRDFLKTI
ncbi:glycosyltransferase [Desertibacillus haloalkaliphilus]|uniref:glycosyltransferase n=1 Tax=Desertibacillus haloalkaliphilus TaxID=1328930 RepID=UPI001C2649F7|nr:glycosyltransferase [Desertibacillus haloalkaliphilus]MBU8908467.1 glycosyltransferase [Desertibacillus haloalkaliphilus]